MPVNGTTMTFTGELVVAECWCGIKLAVPRSLYDHAHQSSDNHIYCPLGHTFVYRRSDAEKQKERADLAERRLAAARRERDRALEESEEHRRSAIALRGHITRLRNKIANGVCPVDGCKRNFANVKGHIERMHPTWAHEHPEVMASE